MSRHWQTVFIDLHHYGYWSCQLALLAGLRRIYEDFCRPGYRWPNADLVVRHLSQTATVSAAQTVLRNIWEWQWHLAQSACMTMKAKSPLNSVLCVSKCAVAHWLALMDVCLVTCFVFAVATVPSEGVMKSRLKPLKAAGPACHSHQSQKCTNLVATPWRVQALGFNQKLLHIALTVLRHTCMTAVLLVCMTAW